MYSRTKSLIALKKIKVVSHSQFYQTGTELFFFFDIIEIQKNQFLNY